MSGQLLPKHHNIKPLTIQQTQSEDDNHRQNLQTQDAPLFHQNSSLQILKINKQQLYRYGIAEPLEKKYQGGTKQEHIKVLTQKQENNHPQIHSDHSMKLIKPIGHRITSGKIKNTKAVGKENQVQQQAYQSEAIKIQKNELHKVASAYYLKNPLGRTTPIRTVTEGIRDISSKKEDKNERKVLNRLKLTQGKSKQMLNRTYSRSPATVRYEVQGGNWGLNLTVDYSGVLGGLSSIEDKQSHLQLQKIRLEQQLKSLKENIQKQGERLTESKKNQQRLIQAMKKEEQISKYSLQGAVLQKKKAENCQYQARNLEYRRGQANSSNLKLTQAIHQEKQLVGMYQSVIEELKCQLKIEKHTKLTLQKRVAVLKKTLQSVQAKSYLQQSTTRELFGKIYSSLGSWQR